jgi:hypothetical protein
MALPLSVVVLVSMFKDAYEDYKRHASDKEENTQTTEVYDPDVKEFVKKMWW